jgi:hypothetical protein
MNQHQGGTSKRVWIVTAVAVTAVCVILAAAYPVAKGKWQFRGFVSRIKVDMSRQEVHQIADKIGYVRFQKEVHGKGIIQDETIYPPSQITDVYYFKNIMLDSAVSIRYDDKGKVLQIVTE